MAGDGVQKRFGGPSLLVSGTTTVGVHGTR
jgi:hypothetical protein